MKQNSVIVGLYKGLFKTKYFLNIIYFPLDWEQKSSFKLSSRHNNNKGSLYREKPYSRVSDTIYH
jgi:hypothetical protein